MLAELAVFESLPGGFVEDGKGPFFRRAEGYVRWAAAWSGTANDGHALERVCEATGLSDGGAGVEARDQVRWATGSWVGE